MSVITFLNAESIATDTRTFLTMMTATSFWTASSQVMKRGLHTLSQKPSSSQCIGITVDLRAKWNSKDYVSVESDVHGVLRQSGSNPRRQTSMTQDIKVGPTVWQNVSVPEVNMFKNSSTLAVSVPINLSTKLGFVSINGPRVTYFVDRLCNYYENMLNKFIPILCCV